MLLFLIKLAIICIVVYFADKIENQPFKYTILIATGVTLAILGVVIN